LGYIAAMPSVGLKTLAQTMSSFAIAPPKYHHQNTKRTFDRGRLRSDGDAGFRI
jgi:hypothetical protein